MKKIGYILLEVIFTLITLVFGLVTAYSQSLYTKAENSGMPLIEYNGKIYEKAALAAEFETNRNLTAGFFAVFLLITVLIFIAGIKKSKKAKNG